MIWIKAVPYDWNIHVYVYRSCSGDVCYSVFFVFFFEGHEKVNFCLFCIVFQLTRPLNLPVPPIPTYKITLTSLTTHCGSVYPPMPSPCCMFAYEARHVNFKMCVIFLKHSTAAMFPWSRYSSETLHLLLLKRENDKNWTCFLSVLFGFL